MANPTSPADAIDELRAIYEREIDYVWRTLTRLGVPERDRPDLAHEVFVVVHRKLAEYDRSRPLRPWLFGIAVRVVVGQRRRATGNELLEELDAVDRAADPEASTIASQRLQRGLEALERIPLEQRIVFIRTQIEGSSVTEVAEELGIPLNTAYSRLRLARSEFDKVARALDEEKAVSHG